MKKTITLTILTIAAFVTFGQGVYDDFIYTRTSLGEQDLIKNINAQDPIWVTYRKSNLFAKHSQVASNIEKLLRQKKIKDLKVMLDKNQIPVNDIDFFWHQVDDSKNIFHEFKLLDSLATIGTDEDGMQKTIISYNYILTRDNAKTINYRLYFMFHWQNDATKSMDIMLVEMP